MIELHFIRPQWLVTIPMIVAGAWYLRARLTTPNDWPRVVDPTLLEALMTQGSNANRRGYYLVVAILIISAIAMAGPSFSKDAQPMHRSGSARIVLLDVSLSMNAQDIIPSRMIRARQIATRLLEQPTADQVGLIAYAGDAWLVAPLTHDSRTLTAMLPVVDTRVAPVQGSRPDRALTLAADVLARSSVRNAEIFVLNDGFRGTKAFDVAEGLARQGHRVSVMAIGTTAGARIPLRGGGFMRDFEGRQVVARVDHRQLEALAAAGDGDFASITDDDTSLAAWTTRSQSADTQSASAAEKANAQLTTWHDDGPWLLLPVLVLAASMFRRSWLFVIPLAVGIAPPEAHADWIDLWQRADQQTAEAMHRGDYEQALSTARNGAWLGAISYRRGQYESAAIFFAADDTADAHYNRGNALAKLERFEQALSAYDMALTHDPEHRDALFNRELILTLVDEQQRRERSGSDGRSLDESEGGESRRPRSGNQFTDQPGTNDDDSNDNESSPPDGAQGDDVDSAASDIRPQAVTPEYTEIEQMNDVEIDVWLEQVPDDPGGWLKRRFQMQQARYRRERSTLGDAW